MDADILSMSDDIGTVSQRSDTELELALQEVWQRKRELSEAAALICSELIYRTLDAMERDIPGWDNAYIVEDMSHDLPHAHIRALTASGGEIVALRGGPSWNISDDITRTLDDIAFQLYTLASDLFCPHPLTGVLEASERAYLVHSRRQHA